MNTSTKEIFKKLLRFFPPTLILLMLGFFSYFSWNYKLIVDDFQFQSLMREKSVLDAARYLYDGFNGRMASHLFLCSIFKIFQNRENLFFIYHFALLLGFMISLAYFLKKYLETFREKLLDFKQATYYSAFITSFLFFFFFAGRVELWFWISATGVYLISLILAFLAFAFVLNKKQNIKTIIASLLLFFLVGGFSESFAVMYLFLLLALLFFTMKQNGFLKNHLESIISGITGLTAALAINYISEGLANRMSSLPDFKIFQSLKNTLHSLVLPFLKFKYLPFMMLLVIALILYSRTNRFSAKQFLKRALWVFLFITLSFFIPCFLLSDIVATRMASLGVLAGVLFLFDYFIFRSDAFPEKQKEPSH